MSAWAPEPHQRAADVHNGPAQVPQLFSKSVIDSEYDTVLVIDFGAQYAQLIARRVREAHVYSELVPSTMPVAELMAKEPGAVILSGGPSSVYAEGAPQVDPALFESDVPMFGICYGFQAMA